MDLLHGGRAGGQSLDGDLDRLFDVCAEPAASRGSIGFRLGALTLISKSEKSGRNGLTTPALAVVFAEAVAAGPGASRTA